jgi:hypothetical protein
MQDEAEDRRFIPSFLYNARMLEPAARTLAHQPIVENCIVPSYEPHKRNVKQVAYSDLAQPLKSVTLTHR